MVVQGMKLSDLPTADEIHEEDMRNDPEYRRLYEAGMSYDTEHVEILSDRDATVVYISLGDIEVTGSSRRTPGDEPDREIGELLALSRAYGKLSAKLAKRANAKVNHAAEIQRHKEERKAAEEPGKVVPALLEFFEAVKRIDL